MVLVALKSTVRKVSFLMESLVHVHLEVIYKNKHAILVLRAIVFNAAPHNVLYAKKGTLLNKITVKNVQKVVNHANHQLDALNVKMAMFLIMLLNFV